MRGKIPKQRRTIQFLHKILKKLTVPCTASWYCIGSKNNLKHPVESAIPTRFEGRTLGWFSKTVKLKFVYSLLHSFIFCGRFIEYIATLLLAIFYGRQWHSPFSAFPETFWRIVYVSLRAVKSHTSTEPSEQHSRNAIGQTVDQVPDKYLLSPVGLLHMKGLF